MASIIKVNDIQNTSGANIINESSNTITIGASGDNIIIPSGATITNNGTSVGLGGTNTPAFQATLSSSISLSNNIQTKIPADTIDFDTDSCYDNTTNYRFTPTTSGKYLCYAEINIQGGTINTIAQVYLRKNGSTVKMSFDRYAGDGDVITNCVAVIDFNGTTDYFEAYARQNTGGTKDLFNGNTFFGAYKLIGA